MPWQGHFPQLFRTDGCSAAATHGVGDVPDDPFPLQNVKLADPGTAKTDVIWATSGRRIVARGTNREMEGRKRARNQRWIVGTDFKGA